MRRKPVVFRELATRDALDAASYYRSEGSVKAAIAFIKALEQACRHISQHPANGSPRYAHELSLPELRVWSVKSYPWLVFYIERPQHIEVWRVLHAEREIPASLRGPGKDESA